MKKWTVLDKQTLIDSPKFKFMQYKFRHSEKNSIHNFYILDTTDWTNIIPLTPDNQVVLVKQYRAGIDLITLELPGGIIDDDETPEQASVRELEEETGYRTTEIQYLGFSYPNPSFMTNKCHFFVAKNVMPTGKTHFDPSEYIEIELVPLNEIQNLITTGKIQHSLSLNAFTLYQAKNFKCFN